MKSAGLNPLQIAIVKTAAYSQVFGADLNFKVLRSYLLSSQLYFPLEILQAWIDWPRNQDFNRPSLAKNPPSYQQIAQHKWNQLRPLLGLISFLPSIEAVMVTGSLAINPQAEDDVDFLVITSPGTLWITRLMVSVWSQWHGRLRRRQDNQLAVNDKWCFNYWLTSNNLQLSDTNLYQARELVQAVTIYDRSKIALSWLLLNSWASQFTAHGWYTAWHRTQCLLNHQALIWYLPFLRQVALLLLRMLNGVAFIWQKKFMKVIPSDLVVELDQAIFHRAKRAQQVQQEYEKILESWLS